ncbi:VOC family protein [Pseudomonas sp. FP2196]|uniref:VOC domain-containing protein n=1 Tax=Pseudomonas fluorescens TaxID=294 RepID=A0A423MAB7_PSEFL|nr:MULTISPECIES: VOC family protein [Pseudomonas]RON79780.1 hypothetical protein BK670_19985 [Pseudomonas fluorescens]WLH37107.1 VOC family protein [Pseudomonas sp. FP2196]
MNMVGIDHVQIEAKDLEETISFWKSVLGFETIDLGLRLGMRWVILKNPGNHYISIHESRSVDNKPGPRITHFGIVVDDFEGFRDLLKTKGVRVDAINVYDKSRSYYFYDPNNHKVEVSEVWGGGL